MYIVCEDMVPVPFIRIVWVKKWISQDIAVFGVFKTVVLVYQYSTLPLWSWNVVQYNFHYYLFDVHYLVIDTSLDILDYEVNLDFNIPLLQPFTFKDFSSFDRHTYICKEGPYKLWVVEW